MKFLTPIYLVSEDGKSFSLGRLSFWIALGISIYFWFFRPVLEFPPSLMEFLFASLAYNLVKKGVSAYQNVRTLWCGNQPQQYNYQQPNYQQNTPNPQNQFLGEGGGENTTQQNQFLGEGEEGQ